MKTTTNCPYHYRKHLIARCNGFYIVSLKGHTTEYSRLIDAMAAIDWKIKLYGTD